MTQALFEVQTFDGHGWVTRHRGADVDAAGEAARHVLPHAKKQAVRIVRQSFDPARRTLDEQVVFSLGKPRRRLARRAFGVAAAFGFSALAIVGATLAPSIEPADLAALFESPAGVAAPSTPADDIATAAGVEPAPAATMPDNGTALAVLTPAAGSPPAFDCDRQAEQGLVRTAGIAADLEQLYVLCGRAILADPTAQTELAARFAAGTGTVADPVQAIRWYQEAARAGHVPAYRPLADLLAAAGNAPADVSRGISWYHRAAMGGDAAAAVALADRYRSGAGVDQDLRIALSYDLMAAEAGDTDAMLRAADAFRSGTGTDSDPDAARRWLERAGSVANGEQAAPQLQWSAPADIGQQAALDPAAPAPGALVVPVLHLDFDRDLPADDHSFAGAVAHASV
ncbi:MAG: tetratricopeptide repeat protein [Alphaproteobacteria bacterium]